MQIPEKKHIGRNTKIRGAIYLVAIALLISAGWQWRLKQGLTVVNQQEVVIAEVKRGELVREVLAPGSLVPISSNFVAASSNGRIKEILLQPSDEVKVGSVIMKLDNPELLQSVDQAKLDVEVLRASYRSLQQSWKQNQLKQRIAVADFETRYEVTRLRRIANQQLLATKAVSDIDYRESLLLEQQLKFQHGLELELLKTLPSLEKAELASAQAQLNKAERQLLLRQTLANELIVRASANGILQDIPFQVGEPVRVGTLLARIAKRGNLKAQLRVPESQIKDVRQGQVVRLAAGGHYVAGKVVRLNPSVKDGIVKVDVHFSQEPLRGARPDLRIEGVIELERLDDVLYVKRPVFSQEQSTSSLFLLNNANDLAERTLVKFGRGSQDVIEILSGLRVGDRLIVSSTQKYETLNKISLR